MPIIPPDLGTKVTTRTINWSDQCERAWGSEFRAPDKRSYNFSDGISKDSTDKGRTGIYGVQGDNVLLLDGTQYPDMRDGILQEQSEPFGSLQNGKGDYQEINAEPLP